MKSNITELLEVERKALNLFDVAEKPTNES